MSRYAELTDPNVAKALAHPLRVRILAILEQRVATPRQLAHELDWSLPHLSYHVRQLERLGLITLVATRPVRGTVEHQYRAEKRPEISNDSWATLPEVVKESLVAAALSHLGDRANAAAASGGFSRPQMHLDRTSVVLDQRGLEELSAELVELQERVERIEEASRKRLVRAEHEGELRMTLGLLLFDDAVEGTTDRPDGGALAPARRTRAGGQGRGRAPRNARGL